jgi:indole-3-glycerol phosphate synthase
MPEASATRETGTFLDKIVAARRVRLAEDRAAHPEARLAELLQSAPPVRGLATLLRTGRAATPEGARVRLIAEVKRASPSKGVFDADLDAVAQAGKYARAGAAAISILTEPDFFAGSIADLAAVSAAFEGDPDRPALLRKEFIWDEYQLLEARAHGADAVLLIVMLLEPDVLSSLIARTRDLGMEPLIEVHDEPELRIALDAGARVVGVNNRNLQTFEEDLGTTERLAGLVSPESTLVAESAIRSRADAERMANAGAHALLVGEALVTGDNVEERAREFMLAPAEAAPAPSAIDRSGS